MDCWAENRSSHRRSFPERNDLTEWGNTDRPVMHSMLCNILVGSSGRMGEYGRLVTNQFEGTGVVVGAHLTRRNLYHRVFSSKSRIFNSFSSVRFPSRFHIPISPFHRSCPNSVGRTDAICFSSLSSWAMGKSSECPDVGLSTC